MLYYVHGYLSSPDGSKGTILKEQLDVIPIKYRDVPAEQLVIKDCINEIKKVIADDDHVVLIGSSLGGCLVSQLLLDDAEKIDKIFLINPALIPPDIDISSIPDMPKHILQDMKDDRLFSQKLDTKIVIFSANQDSVVPPDWVVRFGKFQEATVCFLDDDHRFSNNLEHLPELIKSFL